MARPILVIDDSENILIRIKEFLEKLGQKEIHLENNADAGLKKFQELAVNGVHPIVFMDYDIKDIFGMPILGKLLELDPDGEVIIMTALEKDSENISKLINEGAYDILSKPIRLDTLRKVLLILESENN